MKWKRNWHRKPYQNVECGFTSVQQRDKYDNCVLKIKCRLDIRIYDICTCRCIFGTDLQSHAFLSNMESSRSDYCESNSLWKMEVDVSRDLFSVVRKLILRFLAVIGVVVCRKAYNELQYLYCERIKENCPTNSEHHDLWNAIRFGQVCSCVSCMYAFNWPAKYSAD